MEYTFSKLNDREFESLIQDVISKQLKLNIEKFKSGKDGGVDGRFWIGKREGILQCKHYWKTGYKGLIHKLKSEEVDKVKKLNPDRYLFITSVPLSRKNKKEIFNIFSPYIKSEIDIWGEDDLNTFLSKKENQDVVEKNYKLWITSSQILDILFNNAIKGRSEATLKEIESNNEKYIITDNHLKGFKILNENNVIIITGEPGIGKTILANNLALYYVANGFEFCDIEESISEAENIYREKEKKKMIFYCDDFLGSNMYDAISNKRDSHIVKFIERIKNDKTKKFILTSRTNILTKALSLSHQFQNHKIRDEEFLLRVENLSRIDKAQILYNHIYHSNIDNIYIDQIYKEKRYLDIIKHRNYNPRIIEFITDNTRILKIKPEQYWDYIINKLENPEDIWSDFFQNQVDESVRILSFLTVFNGGLINENVLRIAYSYLKNNKSITFADHTDHSFNAVRKLAIKSLLNRSQSGTNEFYYTLFNPSIGDFILNSYLEDVDLLIAILESLGTNTSLIFLNSLRLNNKISYQNIQKIQFEIFNRLYKSKLEIKDWDYLVLLSYISTDNPLTQANICHFINELSDNKNTEGSKLYELLFILNEFHEEIEILDFSFIVPFIKNTILDSTDVERLLEFTDNYKINDEYVLSIMSESITSYFADLLNDNKSSIDVSNHFRNSYADEYGYTIDYEGIQEALESLLDSMISDFGNENLNNIYIDRSGIIANIDIEKIAEDYISSHIDYDDEFRGNVSSYSDNIDDIEAIFERS
jgi:hypothetical protein